MFFHPALAHGSGENTSAERRRIATLWFVGGPED
jgi:ectoine hydroxylase-related dioxygenase (phytanoyl-CoA dioxygenase family)